MNSDFIFYSTKTHGNTETEFRKSTQFYISTPKNTREPMITCFFTWKYTVLHEVLHEGPISPFSLLFQSKARLSSLRRIQLDTSPGKQSTHVLTFGLILLAPMVSTEKTKMSASLKEKGLCGNTPEKFFVLVRPTSACFCVVLERGASCPMYLFFLILFIYTEHASLIK